jgi:tetratricopeptide (TPR) repeat protein
MALDREKTFAAAERLLKLGKTREALDECRRLAEDAPKDLLMLNRVGDLLARSGRGIDAIGYYEKIAEQFSASGFYPKAIAIIKKILKVDPQRTEALVRLGELNLKQKLPVEARTWLLMAADVYLKTRNFGKAREVYERLVQAEPDNFVHAVRLAEARAAEGDPTRAGRDLITLAGRMTAAGRHEDADRTYKRAIDLLPGRAEAVVGLARVHAAAGRRDEAMKLADDAWSKLQGAESVAADLFLLFEHLGDDARVQALLGDERADGIDDESIEQACRSAITQGHGEAFWSRVLVLVDRWARTHRFDRAAQLLERLARVEEGGHLPALERLVELRKAEGNRPSSARAIERLVRVYQSKGRQADVPPLLETLKLFDASSPLLLVGRPAGTVPPRSETRAAAPPPPAPASGKDSAAVAAFEAPAVPLSPADEEFVSGHLTEAEVFEKYGLHAEAMSQLKAVAERFPGHVAAADKLVGYLRTGGDRGALRTGLITLAFARRASGDLDGAKRAAGEATQIGGVDAAARSALERFGLLPAAEPSERPAAAPRTPAAAPAKPKPAAASPVTREAEEEELEILFDDGEDAVAPAAVAEAGAELREEIEFYLSQGMVQDALARIAEARAQGASGPALDALEKKAHAASASVRDAVVEDKLDAEDLSTIAAALEAQFPGDRAPVDLPAEPEGEQSVDEVFAAFKEHIKDQVDRRDFRTHYDLGIAYKEMGLGEDAIAEFKIASGAPELYREACSMIGMCHWERGESDEAIRWYRAALDAPADEGEPLSGLRYDLAEILLSTGDERGAYDLFSQVLEVEPAYRDVKDRIEELRGRLSR